jgi:uncharacterized membrane protein
MSGWLANVRRCVAALRKRGWRELLFLASVWFKGLDGLLELIGGIALLSVSPMSILHVTRLVTQDEITENARDLVANALRHAAAHLSLGGKQFMAIYLLIHGAVKLGLVWALLRRVLVAYPVSMVVFAGFIAYQVYRYTFTKGIGLLVLSAVDLVVIVLIQLEYLALRRGCT